MRSATPIEAVHATAYVVPTDSPESDGTSEWASTTLVIVKVEAGGKQGIGYTYGDSSIAKLIQDRFAKLLVAYDAMSIPKRWSDMVTSTKNIGRSGISSTAISAVDIALWDLKAKLLDTPLAMLLGLARPSIPAYGSGGFTTYSQEQLREQLTNWLERGFDKVKIKIGRNKLADVDRVSFAREVIGPNRGLFVDASGAYTRTEALEMIDLLTQWKVSWFEDPIPCDDVDGLRILCQQRPGGVSIAAGEYGFELSYFRRLLQENAIDTLQVDATRCGGITGFLAVANLCDAFGIPLATRSAPALHASLGCVAQRATCLEYSHDHARVEKMFFEGLPLFEKGHLKPDFNLPGLGITFKENDMACYKV